MLSYDDDTATIWYHVITTLSYIWPLGFAIVADSGLGKTKSIAFGLIVYVIGMCLTALGGMPQAGVCILFDQVVNQLKMSQTLLNRFLVRVSMKMEKNQRKTGGKIIWQLFGVLLWAVLCWLLSAME